MTSDRDQEMLDRYVAGETLESIGASFGVTRERVRQIVTRLGADAEKARAARAAARDDKRAGDRADFLARFDTLARALAAAGASRPEVVRRIRAFHPDVRDDLADDALRSSGIVFNQENDEAHFPTSVLLAGLWYLLGSEHSLTPDSEWGTVHLAEETIDDLTAALDGTEATPGDVATILGVIAAAQRRATEDPTLTITGARYEELRRDLVGVLGGISAKGARPWPSTRQTIMKRFGGWNDALELLGLAVGKGRPKGMVVFDEADYRTAIVRFLEYADSADASATYGAYERWVEHESPERRWPSGASMRNYFGGWAAARRAGAAAISATPEDEGAPDE